MFHALSTTSQYALSAQINVSPTPRSEHLAF